MMINIDKNLFLQYAHNIIAVTSGIGSVGKTWLATTLAQALNIQKRSVLLFDAGGGLSGIDFQLGLAERQTLDDVLKGQMTFNQAITHINKRRFDALIASAGSDLLENLPEGQLQILRDYLMITAQNYDYVIVDLPPSEKVIKHLMPLHTKKILVCTGEPSDLVNAYRFLQNTDIHSDHAALQIVINYAQSYEDGLRAYNTLRHACEQYVEWKPRFLGVVRRDTRVRDAIRNHVLLLNRYPNSEAAEDVMRIAAKIINGEPLNENVS